ncbi:MAG: P27 family phage terminase small subunit [Pseudonocardiales bacterium]
MLHGNTKTHPNQINNDEPIPLAQEPDRPTDLTEAQLVVWDFTVSQLKGMKLLHRADQYALRALVIATERADKAGTDFSHQPLVVRNPANGVPMANPMMDLWLRLSAQHLRLATQFGLTPSARASIRTTQAAAQAPQTQPGRLLA